MGRGRGSLCLIVRALEVPIVCFSSRIMVVARRGQGKME